MHYVENGRVALETEGGVYTLVPGDLSVTRPWEPHRLGAPHVGPTRVHWFILGMGVRHTTQRWRWPDWILLTPADRQEFAQRVNQGQNPVWHVGEEHRRCFSQMAEIVQAVDYRPGIAMMAVLVNEVLLLLLQQMRRHGTAQEASSTDATESVEGFWQELRTRDDQLSREWTLTRMARQCDLGVTHFIHVTKRLFNLTPSQYLQQCRLEYAADQLLQHPEQRVIDVAMGCGFGSGQYFSHCFRKRFGCSPQMFRNTRNPEFTE